MAGSNLFVLTPSSFAASLGTHTQTARISYTVNTGKRSKVIVWSRLFESSALAFNTCVVFIVIKGTTIATLRNTNTLNKDNVFGPYEYELNEGDQIRIDTSNTSATALWFEGSVDIKEYN